MAKVTAATGGGDAKAEADIQVGQSDDSKPTVLVSVSPNNIKINESATVVVIVRNADGTPAAAGQPVILTTTLGSFTDPRPKTKADGTATTMLKAGDQAGTATVSAIFGSSAAVTQDVTIRDAAAKLNLQVNPSSIASSGGDVTLTATAFNAQNEPIQGVLVNFNSTKGTLDNTQAVTNANGQATATLTLTATDLTNVCSVTVMASTGTINADEKTITVSGNTCNPSPAVPELTSPVAFRIEPRGSPCYNAATLPLP